MRNTKVVKVAVAVLAVVAVFAGAALAGAKIEKVKKIKSANKKTVARLSKTVTTDPARYVKVKGSRRTIPGKIVALNNLTTTDPLTQAQTVTFQGFTMKKGNRNYTVMIGANTQLKDRLGAVITADKLLVGHKVSVKGLYTKGSDSQIVANSVRDVTIPIEVTTETETD